MPIQLIIIFVTAVIFLIVIGIICKHQIDETNKILAEGTETEAVVSKTDHTNTQNGRHYSSYAKFIGDDKIEYETLLSVGGELRIGEKIKIKYLPGKYDYAMFVQRIR